ncbi:MAG TPA: GNAT family N-acetyltransferase [Bacteroidales bacterium]|jgi:ribosomal protein S18 acetylase RimI-like enzyme|nr:GNAT family N-acetyltransferase [Bacteroidales bacterium]HOG57160.1 GNAT family N-acetyltransferase [Bacteroidales bacterium]HPV16737.1 GNAT family N-acetyltransferase [Bacteroidales bacterium]HPX44050.1 GNAT family N-acetyltransferase [Bacteroidales bacterium]HQB86550.1 GNAT family N-acetyltransferase [Bacteroidales bacterium]
MMKIREIKRYGKETFKAVSALIPQLSPESPPLSEEHFRKIIRTKGSHLFIAEYQNRIVGMLTLATYPVPTADRYWIEDVVIDKSVRGKGFGREIINFAIEFARQQGAKTIDLTSRPARIEANELYKSVGFRLRETNAYRYYF